VSATDDTIAALDRGEIRIAERSGDDWFVNE
jgi:Tetrahydrodipicolinate N-succinyltransferase N-terminal